MIRIYVQNKPLYLIDKITKDTEPYIKQPGTVFADQLIAAEIGSILEEMEKETVNAGVFQQTDESVLLQAFKSYLTVVQAAGGLVYTDSQEVLLIFRRGKWDLPKGKLEEGERIDDCAVREIEEETGIKNLSIVQALQITYHTYHEKGKHILKESHWFLIKAGDASALTPQTEEDIEKCEWVHLSDLPVYTSNMHASIIDVVREGEKLLTKTH